MKNYDYYPLDLLEHIFGEDYFFRKIKPSGFPLIYLSNFDIYDVKGSFKFLFVVPVDKTISNDLILSVYRKLTYSNTKAVIYLYDSSKSNKHFFKESNVNFISSDGDYLFFSNNRIQPSNSFLEKYFELSYTKLTQLIVNFYLNNKIKGYTVREISNEFDFSYSSVSRANAFLHEIGAVEKVGNNTAAKYFVRSKKELLEKVTPYFINPIKRRQKIYLNSRLSIDRGMYLSGDDALSFYAGLESYDGIKEIATSKNDFIEMCKRLERSSNNDRDSKHQVILYLEEFIYDPKYYSSGSNISMLDAYIIALKRYGSNSDARISGSIRKMKQELIRGE